MIITTKLRTFVYTPPRRVSVEGLSSKYHGPSTWWLQAYAEIRMFRVLEVSTRCASGISFFRSDVQFL